MEALYAKLYDKYNSLKKKKMSEMDEVNKEQEVKFLNYVSAAEELIQYMKDENERLRMQLTDLRSEVASIRATKDEQYAEHQKLLTEENQKNKMLSEEVERLQKMLQEGTSKDGSKNNGQLAILEPAQITSRELSSGSMGRKKRKCSQEVSTQMEEAITPSCSDQEEMVGKELAKGSSIGNLLNNQLPQCSNTAVGQSGGDVANCSGPTNCQFQALTEYLVGMKLSTTNPSEGICISALHPSSGYSFRLTWVKKSTDEEPELLYRVLTLGTFERVAPEWMRSVLMFSISMCPIFFERIARVIKLHR